MNVDVISSNPFHSTSNILIPDGHKRISWVVDCGDGEKVVERLRNNRIDLCGLFLTHCHFDHILGLNNLIECYPNIKIYTSDIGVEMLQDARGNLSHYWGHPIAFSFPDNIVVVKDGDEVKIDKSLIARAFFTPGHNPSCITWLIDNCLFTGDSFIPGIKTVTNLPGGNKAQAVESLTLIKMLAKDKVIYPGHLI